MNILGIVLSLWQLPQNIIGILVLMFTRNEPKDGYWMWKNIKGGISLGNYIFLSRNNSLYRESLRHEQGHQMQSIMLGPMYLIVIGIPSVIWCGMKRLGFFKDREYYDFYTEKWANRLAGLKINEEEENK